MRDASSEKNNEHLTTLFLYIVHSEPGSVGSLRLTKQKHEVSQKGCHEGYVKPNASILNHKHVHFKLGDNDQGLTVLEQVHLQRTKTKLPLNQKCLIL